MTAPATATLDQLRRTQLPALQAVNAPPVKMGFESAAGFEMLQRVSKSFAASSLVPQQYQGNLANCMIACEMASRIGASPMQVMQSLYIVHGQPGWSAKFLIASVNSCGRFTALRYEWRGEPGQDDYGCRAWAIEHRTGERLDGIWVDWKMVKAEKWNAKDGSKWKTMADQMFIYRAASFWQRAYAPEISMGMSTAEELADVVDMRPDGSWEVTTASLRGDMKTVNAEESPARKEPAGKAPDAPAMTYAMVRESLEAATTADALDVAADTIGAVADEAQRAELVELYRGLREKLAE